MTCGRSKGAAHSQTHQEAEWYPPPPLPDLLPIDNGAAWFDIARPLVLRTLASHDNSEPPVANEHQPIALTQGAVNSTISDLMNATTKEKGEKVAVPTRANRNPQA